MKARIFEVLMWFVVGVALGIGVNLGEAAAKAVLP